ncbi:MAG TPA: Sua5 family C-terminal domain-containing protein, partial [Burkholderiales bacterium]|nr:Sua5 family C-terminal domain-containing protein [Burkholderiales bacterium]
HVTREALEDALGEGVDLRDESAPRHSGGLERHYSPSTPARLVPPHALDAEIAKVGARAAVLAFSKPDERVDYWLRMPREPERYAQRLYGALREADGAHCDTILIEAPPDEPAWDAVRDRLERAAGAA